MNVSEKQESRKWTKQNKAKQKKQTTIIPSWLHKNRLFAPDLIKLFEVSHP